MSPDQARDFIYKNIGAPLKNFDEKILALYPTIGENLDYINSNRLKNISFIYRKIDQYSWKYCNKGFFNFKNYIPKIIQEFI